MFNLDEIHRSESEREGLEMNPEERQSAKEA